ncbi:MAG: hypothetical protein ABIB47_00095 [Candidatus Woesearchaeota archaeon]
MISEPEKIRRTLRRIIPRSGLELQVGRNHLYENSDTIPAPGAEGLLRRCDGNGEVEIIGDITGKILFVRYGDEKITLEEYLRFGKPEYITSYDTRVLQKARAPSVGERCS